VVATGVLAKLDFSAAMACVHGANELSKAVTSAVKYAACEGASAARSLPIAFATAGMVGGLYQRCGLSMPAGSPSRLWTSITRRVELGVAASMVSMKPSYPAPFCTTSWAVPTVWATCGLASKVCGSVLGLLMSALTATYGPPICEMTLAYSFSAPTAAILPGSDAGPGAQAAESVAMRTAPVRKVTATRPRPPARLVIIFLVSFPWSVVALSVMDAVTEFIRYGSR